MQIALTYISVTIVDICFANGVGSMHLLGAALLRNTVALFVMVLFLEVRKKYLEMRILSVMTCLPPMSGGVTCSMTAWLSLRL